MAGDVDANDEFSEKNNRKMGILLNAERDVIAFTHSGFYH